MMTQSKRIGKSVVVSKHSSSKRVLSKMNVPGVGSITVLKRDAYTDASRKAGAQLKTIIGRPKVTRKGV